MPYTTSYAGLKADIISVTEDNSIELLSNLDAAIAAGENMVWRDLDLDLFQGESVAGVTTLGSPLVSRPAILNAKSVWITVAGKRITVEKRTYDYCLTLAPDSTVTVTPTQDNIFYAEKDVGNWYLAPTPDAAYSISGYGLAQQLSLGDSVPTTWISLNVGDLLLKASLIQAERYLKNPDMVAIWKDDYADILAKAKVQFRGSMRPDYELARQASTASQPL